MRGFVGEGSRHDGELERPKRRQNFRIALEPLLACRGACRCREANRHLRWAVGYALDVDTRLAAIENEQKPDGPDELLVEAIGDLSG
ncbi:MAG: hypothetical protein KF901_02885 [Myxococcales bacterium]|nr:hypothetical protein [Myxococcales bacterium]